MPRLSSMTETQCVRHFPALIVPAKMDFIRYVSILKFLKRAKKERKKVEIFWAAVRFIRRLEARLRPPHPTSIYKNDVIELAPNQNGILCHIPPTT